MVTEVLGDCALISSQLCAASVVLHVGQWGASDPLTGTKQVFKKIQHFFSMAREGSFISDSSGQPRQDQLRTQGTDAISHSVFRGGSGRF